MDKTLPEDREVFCEIAQRPIQGFLPEEGEYAATLYDDRDGKNYRVKRMADGSWWMVDDLRFGRTSEVNEWKASCRNDVKGILGKGLYGVCRESIQQGGGYLYNWQAVMQHQAAAHGIYSSPNAAGQLWQGICPEGWHLPCLYEMIRLNNVLGGVFTGCDAAGHKPAGPLSWEGIRNGYCDLSGIRCNSGVFGYYWTCTANTSLDAHGLVFGSGVSTPQGINGKYLGLGVRAVLNRIR